MEAEIKEHDVVVVKKDSTHAAKGEEGVVVFIYESGNVEVEIFEDDKTKKVVLLLKDEIKLKNDG